MLEDLQIRHYSPTTIRIYLHVIAEFARHFSKPPDQLDAEHIRCYQLFLIKEKRVSQSTYIQTVCALRFFYTHTLSRKIAIERIPFGKTEYREMAQRWLGFSTEERQALRQALPAPAQPVAGLK
jgi:integrase/recombinase XerD